MLLYICPECGKWINASLSKAVASLFEKVAYQLRGQLVDPNGGSIVVQCPDGCGVMTLVQSDDKLSIKN